MDDLGGDPQEVDQAMHWYDREPCPFTREEGEVHGTYVASSMSRNEGDDMRHLDESGVHQVYTIYVEGILGFAPSLPKFAF